MPDNKPEPADSEIMRKAIACANVFGHEGYRTGDQQIVWDLLMSFACVDQPLFELDSNANFDALRASNRDGARRVYLMFNRMISRSKDQKKTKPTIVKE